MNVLALFDGMSCGQLALSEYDVNNYYASEIDKFAIQQTQHNFPNTIQLGDISNWRTWAIDFSYIDLVLAGSPCQGFSFAGKQLNFSDPRSALFFVFVDILNHIKKLNPDVKFLLENVNMKKEYLRIMSEYMGVFPVNINSNLVSAQNRNRWYWSNIKTKETGLFSELWTDIPQPKDKGILLKDILQPESEIEEKYYIKNPIKGFEGMSINGKSNNLRVGGHATQSKKHNFDIIKLDKNLNEKNDQNKASCLTGGGNSGGNHSDMDVLMIGCVKFGRNDKAKKIRKGLKDYSPFNEKEITGIDYEKMNTITCATQKDNLLTNGIKLRRLTVLECSRLQTIPEDYKWIVSNSQAYKMLGNGWTIDVIKHILSFI